MQIEEDIEGGVSRTRDALVPYLVRGASFRGTSDWRRYGASMAQTRLRDAPDAVEA
ncbi:hypothetical protein [Bacteroides sp.]|uniref:hypothetical protein n=1 Tax=Bacteroides sp. TaxID=29523 RepID=UPI003A932F2C